MSAAKVYLDEDVHPFIAHALRLRGWNALTTVEAGQQQASDIEQIEFATRHGYAILSYNIRDFPRLHGEILGRGDPHGGIVVATQDDPRRNIRALLNLLAACTEEDLRNQLVYLSNWM